MSDDKRRQRFMDLIDSARNGSRWGLDQLGLEFTPEVIEALWEIEPPTARKGDGRPRKRVLRSWSLWNRTGPLPADPAAYISRAVRRRAKQLKRLDDRGQVDPEQGLYRQPDAPEMGEPSVFAREHLLSVAMSDRVRRMIELMDSGGLTRDEARRKAGVSGRELKSFLTRVEALRLR